MLFHQYVIAFASCFCLLLRALGCFRRTAFSLRSVVKNVWTSRLLRSVWECCHWQGARVLQEIAVLLQKETSMTRIPKSLRQCCVSFTRINFGEVPYLSVMRRGFWDLEFYLRQDAFVVGHCCPWLCCSIMHVGENKVKDILFAN